MESAKRGADVIAMPGAERPGKVFNCEITYNLGSKAQLRILTDFPQGMSQAELAASMDRLAAQGRRQQARYELEELEQELENLETEDAQHKENLERAEADHKKKLALAEAKVTQWDRKSGEIESLAKTEYANSNRRGDFDIGKTSRGKEYVAAGRSLTEAQGEVEKLEVERTRARLKIALDRDANKKARERVKARIERTRKLLEVPAE